MNGTMIETARAEVRNRFGSALESKASDQLVMKLAGLALAGAEAVIPTQGAILEFKPEDLAEASRSARKEIEELPAWQDFQSAVAAAAPEVRRQSRAQTLVRPQVIQAAKSRFRKASQGVRETLAKAEAERAPAGPAIAPESLAVSPEAAVQSCWLNGTMRTGSTTPALAEVAADEQIVNLDVPRRLVLDISETAGVVGAPELRQQSGGSGRGVVVAVIDTEVAVGHAAFGGRAEQRANFSGQDLGSPQSHGTAVAGIIASEDDTFTGMAPEATVFAYKVFPLGTDFEGALAIERALEDGAHIANCSWGAGPAADGSSREARACDNAWELGLAIVKSAGNSGPSSRTLTTPADANGVIVVGATDREGKRVQDYSSRGPTSDGRNRPHLVAPGGSFSDRITSASPLGGFAQVGPGTSFAAPHVAGLLALLYEANPDFGPDELRDALLAKCRELPGVAVDDQGSGLVTFA